MSNHQTSWVCVFKTNRHFEAEAAKGHLEAEGIPCVLLNKQDSSYMAFGYVELHVPLDNKQQAELLLKDNFKEEL